MRREKEEETEDKDNINLHAPTGRDGEVCSKIATGHGTARRGELELGQVLFNASARCGGYMQETIAAAEAVRTYVRLHADKKKACGMYIYHVNRHGRPSASWGGLMVGGSSIMHE
jgi:hypothetical protein